MDFTTNELIELLLATRRAEDGGHAFYEAVDKLVAELTRRGVDVGAL